jgi:hypothetical protein
MGEGGGNALQHAITGKRVTTMTALVWTMLLATRLWAAPALPLSFATDPGWTPRPTFLPSPADRPEIVTRDGATTLRVSEPGRGMKFDLPVEPFSVEDAVYLVVTYRARNLGGGYGLWIIDDNPGGKEAVNTSQFIQDGQWHALALDLAALGLKGDAKSILTEVECQGEVAEVSFESISQSNDVPPDATVLPAGRRAAPDRVIRGADLAPLLKAEPGWLAARSPQFAAEAVDGLLHLSVTGLDQGMKWSTALAEPLDLTGYRFAAIRYRATGLAPWGDYFLWLGSGPGGLPDEWAQPAKMADLQPDGHWHVMVAPIASTFTAVNMALEACSATGSGEVWLDSIRFTSVRPMLDIQDALECSPGWDASRLPAGSFEPVSLRAVANDAMVHSLRSLGLSNWLPAGPVTVLGVPFEILDGASDTLATPGGATGTTAFPVGRQATEIYALVTSRLPAKDISGMLGGGPMLRFSTPERCLFEVRYADGVTDEMLPVCVATGANEVRRGVDVYALTNLRPVPVESVALRNSMPTARFMVSAVTANRGDAITPEPAPAAFPPPVAPRPEPAVTASIRPVESGYQVDDGLLRATLQTTGGIRLLALENRCVQGVAQSLEPGPLFEVSAGDARVDSSQVSVGEPALAQATGGQTLTVPFDAGPAGIAVRGELVVEVGGEAGVRMRLNAFTTGEATLRPSVTFPLIRGLTLGDAAGTWYLWARKGGLISSQPTHQRQAYGGEYPQQVADAFSPAGGGGLALMTRDLADVYRHWDLTKDTAGLSWRLDTVPFDHQPGERIEVAPVVLRAHSGDWRRALALYRDWCATWYKPQVAPKSWFQRVFYYQQVFAWSMLYDGPGKPWKMDEVIQRYKDYMGCLDYLHIFDFGESRVYGRVGDYNHYDELGGLKTMRDALAAAQAQGVRTGLYIEGYLCDNRGVWGQENVPKYGMRLEDGSLMGYTPEGGEYMMCPATEGWRNHLAETYKRVVGELRPDGMYIDQFGFVDTWKTCWAKDHGHPVPWGPIRGERDTLQAIRAAVPASVPTLTEETPNDVNSQYQDGALCYSVAWDDPALAPHRVDLFRFQFPAFKVFQLVSYNPFTEGSWQLLKFPFFNGDGFWLHHQTSDYCDDAHQFMRDALRILHTYEDCFCGQDADPLVPTLAAGLYANRFGGNRRTVWTVLNTTYRTYRGPVLRLPHLPGARYTDAFTGRALPVSAIGAADEVSLALGPWAVGCIVAE